MSNPLRAPPLASSRLPSCMRRNYLTTRTVVTDASIIKQHTMPLASRNVQSLMGSRQQRSRMLGPVHRAGRRRALPCLHAWQCSTATTDGTDPESRPSFLSLLNREQRKAATCDAQHVCLKAPPGSGKTRTIVARTEHLIVNEQVPPSSILAITFTRKAAEELKDRLTNSMGSQVARRIGACTFHSFANQILRKHIEVLGKGLTKDYSLLDRDDMERAMYKVIEDIPPLATAGKQKKKKFNPALVASICHVKKHRDNPKLRRKGSIGELLLYECRARLGLQDLPFTAQQLEDVYEKLQRCLNTGNCLEFDDLLLLTRKLLLEQPHILANARERFKHILVDEFQDIDWLQFDIIKLLAGATNNLFVVGDPDQSIYAWRDSDPEYMTTDFPRRYPACQMLYLETNYRSALNVVEVANSMITYKGPPKLYKPMKADRQDHPGHIEYNKLVHELSEQARIVDLVQGVMQKDGMKLSDIAILARTNKELEKFEWPLLQADIPCHIVGRQSLLEAAEIQDVMAGLRLILNPRDATALDHIYALPGRSVGEQTERRMKKYGNPLIKSWASVIFEDLQDVWLDAQKATRLVSKLLPSQGSTTKKKRPDIVNIKAAVGLPSFLKTHPDVVQGAGLLTQEVSGIDELRATLVALRSMMKHCDVLTLVQSLMKLIQSEERQAGKAMTNLNNLQRFARYYAKKQAEEQQQHAVALPTPPEQRLCDFLDFVKLSDDASAQWQDQINVADSVHLMTIHKSKGLEYKVVIVVGLEEENIPSSKSDDLKEEVRLLYVAITRAKDSLYLLSNETRKAFNGYPAAKRPSQFLSHLRATAGFRIRW